MSRIRDLAFLTVLLTASAAAQVPEAGPDQQLPFGQEAQLSGTVLGQSTLCYWMADGDNATENDILTYDSGLGVGVIAQPVTATGIRYNWPADIEWIDGEYYVLDTGKRQLFTLDPATSIATQIGTQTPVGLWDWLTCMAYDSDHDVLYAVDGLEKQLLVYDRTTGEVTPVGSSLSSEQPYWFIKGLAYDSQSGLLIAADDNTETLFSIDPANGAATAHLANLPSGPTALYGELTSFRGALYGTYRWEDAGGIWHAQLRRIDPATGDTTNVGPPIDDLSAHAMLVLSVPEDVVWSQLSGPGTVTFDDERALNALAGFDEPGDYVLQLTVLTDAGPVSDSLQVTLEAAVTYCTGKTNSLGCVPFIDTQGFASATDGDAFPIIGRDFEPGLLGLLLYGHGGRGNLNYHGGKLCVKAPVVRYLPPKLANGNGTGGCPGILRRNFNQRVQSGIDPLLTVGAQVHAQWRQRDSADPAGFGDALSNGVEFLVHP